MIAQLLVKNLQKLQLNDCVFSTMDDLYATLPSESSATTPGMAKSTPSDSTGLKKRRKHQVRITPYTPKSSIKARKSLQF